MPRLSPPQCAVLVTRRALVTVVCCTLAVAVVPAASPTAAAASTVPSFDHVFVVVMENHSYSQIIGSSAAPYINSLLPAGALATDYHGITHPSLPNYVALTAGSTYGITSDCTTCWLGVRNIADSLEASGSTWKAYEESMPSACYVGDYGSYAQKHDPFIYYTDIRTNASRCSSHVVPYQQLATDLQATATTPNYAFITPNMCDDMHDCSVSTGDSWLQHALPQILGAPAFRYQHSLLALTWDEDDFTSANQVPLILMGSGVRAGYRSSTAYNHYSLLRTIEAARGLNTLASGDASASPMSDMLTSVVSTGTPCPTVSLTAQPASPQPAGTQVQLTAAASGCPNPRYAFWQLSPGSSTWQLAQGYGTGTSLSWSSSGKLPGTYRFIVWARDASSIGVAGNTLGSWDAYAMSSYSVLSTACAAVTASASPVSALSGSQVTVAATSMGCSNPLYEFWLLGPGTSRWQLVQAYSSNPALTWMTGGAPAGTYGLSIWVEDANSGGTYSDALGRWDAYMALSYSLTSDPCTTVTASAAGVGSTVTITASAAGCSNPVFEFWILTPGTQTWQLAQAYSAADAASIDMTGKAAGTYLFSIWTRDASSTGSGGNVLGRWDAYASIGYTLG